MGITEIGESRAMMMMIKDIYINNLENVSTDIDRMQLDQKFWYQQHTLDSDAHHLNRHMIDIVQKYIRGDATRMETYTSLVRLYTSTYHAREFLRSNCRHPILFHLCRLIIFVCLTIHR
jgi:hypothetical protein